MEAVAESKLCAWGKHSNEGTPNGDMATYSEAMFILADKKLPPEDDNIILCVGFTEITGPACTHQFVAL